MAVSGLYDLISGIVRQIRRETRVRALRTWPTINGTVQKFRMDEEGRPVMDYVYAVGKESFVGSVSGLTVSSPPSDVPPGWTVQVRYDPDNPARSSVLPDDNRYLSFEIDLDRA